MIDPKIKLRIMREAAANPGAAILLVLEALREDNQAFLEEGLARIEAQIPERAVLKHLKEIKGDKGDPGPGADIKQIAELAAPLAARIALGNIRLPKDGVSPSIDIIVEAMKPYLPPPGKDGKAPTREELIAIAREVQIELDKQDLTEEDVIRVLKRNLPATIEPETGESIVRKINQLPLGSMSQINASHISGLPKPVKGPGTKGNYHAAHGAGAGGGVTPLAYDISSQFDGNATTFVIPSYSAILQFIITGWPPNGALRPTVDFTTPTSTSVALTAQVSAPAAGNTGIVLYVPE